MPLSYLSKPSPAEAVNPDSSAGKLENGEQWRGSLSKRESVMKPEGSVMKGGGESASSSKGWQPFADPGLMDCLAHRLRFASKECTLPVILI